MKLKTKLIATISAFCLVCVMLVVGVWALKNTSFDIGGKISFTASGVKATVSTAVLSNGTHKTPSDESTKMQTFSIEVNDTQDHINQESEDWRNLDLLFNEDGEDVTITFTIHNDNTDSDKYLSVAIGVTQGTQVNASVSVSPSSAIIAPDGEQEFVVTFHITNPDQDASLDGFNLDFDLEYAKILNSATGEWEKDGVVYALNMGELMVSQHSGAAENVEIPALFSDGTEVYTLSTIETESFSGNNSIKTLKLPNTVTYINTAGLYDMNALESVILPTSITDIGISAFEGCEKLTNVIILATTPPVIAMDAFPLNENLKIYVPAGSVDAYKAAAGWSDYADYIEAIQ